MPGEGAKADKALDSGVRAQEGQVLGGLVKTTWFWTTDFRDASARFDTPQFAATTGGIGTVPGFLPVAPW
jgi:hypothetical protein